MKSILLTILMTILGVESHAQEYFHVQKTQLIDAAGQPFIMAHPTFRVMRQSCSAYSLSLKYLSSLKPYALRFITFILLFIPSTLAVEI